MTKNKKELRRKRRESIESLDDYCLDRLFDPEQLYFTPMEELLKRYKKRDLLPGRVYNLSKKYGNVPRVRTRVIIAPQMERVGQRIFGTENFYHPPPKVYLCTKPKEIYNSDYNLKLRSFQNDFETNEENNKPTYSKWLEKRRNLRDGLNKLDLDPNFLKNMKNLSDLEKRVLQKLINVDKEIQTDPIKERKLPDVNRSITPKIKYPTPVAMEEIEKFLNENKWRLLDLFKDLDKNKDWKVKKDDFVREVKNGRLNIPDSLIEELIVALSNSDRIRYKNFAKGRSSHLFDKRNLFKESKGSLNTEESIANREEIENFLVNNEERPKSKSTERVKSTCSNKSKITISESVESFDKSRNNSQFSYYSSYLQLPKIDTRPEIYPSLDNDEIYTDRGVSAASSSLARRSALKSRLNQKNLDINIKKSIEDIREKNLREYLKCIKKTDVIPVKSNSTLLNGLVLPNDKDPQDIINKLKKKSDEEKEKIKLAIKETKLRKKKLEILKN